MRRLYCSVRLVVELAVAAAIVGTLPIVVAQLWMGFGNDWGLESEEYLSLYLADTSSRAPVVLGNTTVEGRLKVLALFTPFC